MQCARTTARSVCAAHNAFDPSLALRAAFGTTLAYRQEVGEKALHSEIGPRPHRPPFDIRKIRYKSRSNIEELDHDAFLERALVDMAQEARLSEERGERIGRHLWPRHVRLVKELSVRLASRHGKAALKRLNPVQQALLLSGMDYTPKVISPKSSDADPRIPCPWAVSKHDRSQIRKGKRVLDMEIERFARYIELTPMERIARQAVTEEILSFLKDALKDDERTGVEVFGSTVTGLAMPLSDIDIRLWNTREGSGNLHKQIKPMKYIREKLYHSEQFGVVSLLRNGSHPIINCQHLESGIQIQIVAGNGPTPQHEAVAKYVEAIPTIRKLYPVVRTFFEMRGLSDVHVGGIGSYGQFVMLAAALIRPLPPAYQSMKPATTGDHLRKFLAFYDTLDTTQRGVAVFPRTVFKKHQPHPTLQIFVKAAQRRGDPVRAGQWAMCSKSEYEPNLLCIQDPANPTNDLGRRSSAAKHIMLTIKATRRVLKVILGDAERFRQHESVLELLVGRCHEVYQPRRQQMEEFGIKMAARVGENAKDDAEASKSGRTEAEAEYGRFVEQMEIVEEGGESESEQAEIAHNVGLIRPQDERDLRRIPMPSFNVP